MDSQLGKQVNDSNKSVEITVNPKGYPSQMGDVLETNLYATTCSSHLGSALGADLCATTCSSQMGDALEANLYATTYFSEITSHDYWDEINNYWWYPIK